MIHDQHGELFVHLHDWEVFALLFIANGPPRQPPHLKT